MSKLEIIYINPDNLIPYENNPRVISDEAVNKVANSIKEFGFINPIVATPSRIVINGHTRLKAAYKLELKEVPCMIADNLDEAKAKALRLADNKTAEYSEWDFTLLAEELDELNFADLDFDMSDFGFDDISFPEDDIEAVEDDFEAEPPEDPISKRGDIWELKRQRNTLHPTMKPIGLIAMAIEDNPKANIIYDAFGGSGSTLIACEQLDRICYMMELDEKYVDVIVNRYIKFKESDEDVFLIRDGVQIPYKEVEKNE